MKYHVALRSAVVYQFVQISPQKSLTISHIHTHKHTQKHTCAAVCGRHLSLIAYLVSNYLRLAAD